MVEGEFEGEGEMDGKRRDVLLMMIAQRL